MAGPLLGGNRRLEGPLGKSDRAIVLSFLGMAIALFGPLPERAWIVMPTFAVGSLITIWNRLVSVQNDRVPRYATSRPLFATRSSNLKMTIGVRRSRRRAQ